MCFLWDGTLERAASATGQLGFIQQAWMDTQRWPPDRTPLHCQPDRRSQVNTDLLRLNLILLVIPDQRVFLKSTVTRQQIKKKGAWGKMTVNQVVISWRWHQETGRSIRKAAACGHVATRVARWGARQSEACPLCKRPKASRPRHKDGEVVGPKRTKS